MAPRRRRTDPNTLLSNTCLQLHAYMRLTSAYIKRYRTDARFIEILSIFKIEISTLCYIFARRLSILGTNELCSYVRR